MNTKIKTTEKLKRRKGYGKSHWELCTMLLPAVILLLIFAYIPMFGIVVAFKDLKFSLGIWGSKWNGLDNFKFLFRSNSFLLLLRNTLGYNIVGMFFGHAIPIILALCLQRVKTRICIKTYQSGMFLPYFLSWIVVSYFTLSLFEYKTGILNNIFVHLGLNRVDFYNTPKCWPFILVFFAVWKGLGYSTLIYYGTLLSIDPTLYEAAAIDGCSKWQEIRHISLPHLVPSVIVLILLGLGSIFKSDYGLYYFIPMDTGALLKVTDVFDTYVFRTLRDATNVGLSSAIAFMQSVVGIIFVVIGNTLARKVDPDCALF